MYNLSQLDIIKSQTDGRIVCVKDSASTDRYDGMKVAEVNQRVVKDLVGAPSLIYGVSGCEIIGVLSSDVNPVGCMYVSIETRYEY